MALGDLRRLHLIGVGGAGMSAIATILLELGCRVSGSDLRATEGTRRLQAMGMTFHLGHRADNVGRPDAVVISSAVSEDNPELEAARARGLKVLRRIEVVDLIMRGRRGIAVSGSHGKTTTTSLVYRMLRAGGFDPTVVVGAKLKELGANAGLGRGDFVVVEADESDGSFLKLSPEIAVATNIDDDHLNYYGSLEALAEAFRQFLERPGTGGLAVLCADDRRLAALRHRITTPVVTYGILEPATYSACHLDLQPRCTRFDAHRGSRLLGRVELGIPGQHHVLNALAALAVADRLGVPFKVCRDACRDFTGAGRRYQRLGTVHGITVMDDYAHHPTEIDVTLATAAREGYRRLLVVFQPHRYTRTERLHRDFGLPFRHASLVVVPPIFPASEPPRAGVTADLIVQAIRASTDTQVVPVPDLDAALEVIGREARPGDLVITMGAGDVGELAPRILEALRERGPGTGGECRRCPDSS